jgi:hypothetical protein
MNLEGIWAESGRLLNDPNNDRWSQAILTTRANEAQTIVQALTKAVKVKETLTPVADTQEVTINTGSIDILRVVLTLANGNKKPIEGLNREELDYRYPNWENMGSGEPDVYFFDATNAQINLVPAPDSIHAIASSLEVWEVRKPADMDDAADVPFDSNVPMTPYHLSIVHWVVAQCWMDDATPESLAKSKFHKSGMLERPGEFEKQIMLIRADFDNPTDIPTRILWRPQGGRLGRTNRLSKSNPMGWGN